MPRKEPECLPIHMVLCLANAVCERYGFLPVDGRELYPGYTMWRAVPAVLRRCDAGRLWVDRWYIAVEPEEQPLEYLYLTRRHIAEEEGSFRALKRLRRNAPELPDDIASQFRIARRWMAPANRNIYFSETAAALGLSWVSAWRDASRRELLKNTDKKRSA